MNDRRDVPQAFRVGAMAMGVEQDVTKIHRTTFVDGTHEAAPPDGCHLGRIHIPRGGIGTAIPNEYGAQIHRARQVGTMCDAVPFEETMHDLKKRRKAPRGRLSG